MPHRLAAVHRDRRDLAQPGHQRARLISYENEPITNHPSSDDRYPSASEVHPRPSTKAGRGASGICYRCEYAARPRGQDTIRPAPSRKGHLCPG